MAEKQEQVTFVVNGIEVYPDGKPVKQAEAEEQEQDEKPATRTRKTTN